MQRTRLESGLPVWNACLCLAELPVNHFIDAIRATVHQRGGVLGIWVGIIQISNAPNQISPGLNRKSWIIKACTYWGRLFLSFKERLKFLYFCCFSSACRKVFTVSLKWLFLDSCFRKEASFKIIHECELRTCFTVLTETARKRPLHVNMGYVAAGVSLLWCFA